MKTFLLVTAAILALSASIKANDNIKKAYIDSVFNIRMIQLQNDSLKSESLQRELADLKQKIAKLDQNKKNTDIPVLCLQCLGLLIILGFGYFAISVNLPVPAKIFLIAVDLLFLIFWISCWIYGV